MPIIHSLGDNNKPPLLDWGFEWFSSPRNVPRSHPRRLRTPGCLCDLCEAEDSCLVGAARRRLGAQSAQPARRVGGRSSKELSIETPNRGSWPSLPGPTPLEVSVKSLLEVSRGVQKPPGLEGPGRRLL